MGRNIAMVEIIEKRALSLSVKIQVDKKEKQILDYKTNKRNIYIYIISLNNNKNIIKLLWKLEFFLVPITGRHIDVETLYQLITQRFSKPIWGPEWCNGFFGP